MYTIEVKNLEELQRRFAESPRIVGAELEWATKESGKEILRTEVSEAPHDTGNLQQSVEMQYKPIQVIVGPRANYALAIEKGTRPHKVSATALTGWARRHGMNPYLVARAIARKGTKANPFVKRTVEQVAGPINKFFKKALQNIIGQL
jgi:HK97 gp10 family phage protein